MYDTLMQMGRWFGYRRNYGDLMRLFIGRAEGKKPQDLYSAFEAICRDRDLWMKPADGSAEYAITTEGDEKTRIKYATASWVYGEELDQNTAMWWSPDGKKIAFYRFDESPTKDFYLQLDQTKLQSRVDIEAYPKAGAPNPVAELFIYDLDTKKTVQVDVRCGKQFDNSVIGH